MVRRQRGAALVIAMVLILVLTIIVATTQYLVAQQLRATKSERNYERALQMAEAGANAYLNELSKGFIGTTGGGAYDFMPPLNEVSSASPAWPVDFATFRSLSRSGDSRFPVRNYPAGQTGQGYVVGHIINGPDLIVFSYGFCNGAVRMVRVSALSFSIFDWAAAYGIDPYSASTSSPVAGSRGPGPSLGSQPDTGPAWEFKGSVSIVGGSGAEGSITNTGTTTWYDGPIFLAAYGNIQNPSLNPTPTGSTPGVPTGHVGTGTIANPFVRRLPRTLNLPTADQAANEWALTKFGVSTTAGTAYFRSNNNNATGLRYLVKVVKPANSPNLNKIRELPVAVSVPTVSQGSDTAYVLNLNPKNTDLTNAGMTGDENVVGIRIYPGTYYFEGVSQGASDIFYIRSFADGEGPGTDASGNTLTIWNSTFTSTSIPNPNSGLSSERNIRIFIGEPTSGSIPSTSFSSATWMENSTYPSRFRIYSGNRQGVSVSGTSSKFNVNMLVYNSTVPTTGTYAGQTVYYGNVTLGSGTYIYGSLLGWQVKTAGGATIEKQANAEPGNSDRLTFVVTGWKEMR